MEDKFIFKFSKKVTIHNPKRTFLAVVTEKYWHEVTRNSPSLRGHCVLNKGQYFSATRKKKFIIRFITNKPYCKVHFQHFITKFCSE